MRVEDHPDQLRLDEPAPYRRESAPSKDAAKAIRKPAGEMRHRVYDYLRNAGPATDEEIQTGLSMNPSTERPRRVELVRMGLVRQVGEGRTRSGRKAALWEAV